MKPLRSSFSILFGLSLFVVSLSGAEPTPKAHWPSWRGPSGQGYSDDTRVPLTWSNTENVVWKTKIPGNGNSSPIVWGDRIFLTAAADKGKERFVVCIRAGDGKILWQKSAATETDPGRTHQWNGYASPSCTTDGTRVYAFFGTPGLFCFDFDGKLIWQRSFGVFTSATGWGTAASPFLFEDLVIQNCDNDGPIEKGLPAGKKPEDAAPMALVALDKLTGKVRWQTPRNQGRGFSTPVLIPGQGRVDLVLNGPLGVWGYDPHTGKEIWHCDRKGKTEEARFGEMVPTFNRDMLFAPSGRPGPYQAIRLGGTGNVNKTHLVWESTRKGHRDVSSQILVDDLIYAADNKGVLSCYEAKTGKLVYEERIGTDTKSLGSPVLVRGKLLFLLEHGETVLVEPGPTLKVVGRNKLDGGPLDFAASPAIADGRIYLRSQTMLYCIGEK